ncbi:MAG TPA: transcriptional repressor LexA [Verrucomicrobiae bacterium]
MPDTLTKRQRQIVDFVLREQEIHGCSPSVREIARHFGFTTSSTVTDHLRLIRQKGQLSETNGKARSIRVLSPLQRFKQRIVDIPVFGSIPAGYGEDRVQEAEGCVSVDVESIGIKPTRNTFALRVTGDSMIGRHILDGDMVVMEHGPEPRHGQIVAALIDGKSTLKTFLVRNRKPYLKAENPKYPDLIPAEELLIQGVFRALIRKSRE